MWVTLVSRPRWLRPVHKLRANSSRQCAPSGGGRRRRDGRSRLRSVSPPPPLPPSLRPSPPRSRIALSHHFNIQNRDPPAIERSPQSRVPGRGTRLCPPRRRHRLIVHSLATARRAGIRIREVISATFMSRGGRGRSRWCCSLQLLGTLNTAYNAAVGTG